MDLCPRAPPLRRRSLQRWRGAWEVVQERMQIVVGIDGIWKMVDLGSWFVAGRYGFLLQLLSWGVPDLEFDGMSGVLPRSDSFNGNGFAFIGEPPWRSAKLHISDGAASSSGVEVTRHFLFWWLLWWCQRQVTVVGVKLRGFFSLVCNFISWLVFLQRLAFCYLFSFVRSVCT